MNKKLSIAMGIALAGMTGVAAADSHGDMGLEFSADMAFTSNYVFRGISESAEEASVSAGIYASHSSGFYASLWGASVSGYDGATMELDPNLGWSGDLGPVGLDVGWLRYNYPGIDDDTANTDEFYIGVSKDFEVVSLGLSYAFSDDFYGAGDNDYWNLSAEVPVGSFSISAHVGSTDRDDGTDYEDYLLGVSTEFGGFGFGLTYTDTDGLGTDEDYVAFSISKAL